MNALRKRRPTGWQIIRDRLTYPEGRDPDVDLFDTMLESFRDEVTTKMRAQGGLNTLPASVRMILEAGIHAAAQELFRALTQSRSQHKAKPGRPRKTDDFEDLVVFYLVTLLRGRHPSASDNWLFTVTAERLGDKRGAVRRCYLRGRDHHAAHVHQVHDSLTRPKHPREMQLIELDAAGFDFARGFAAKVDLELGVRETPADLDLYSVTDLSDNFPNIV